MNKSELRYAILGGNNFTCPMPDCAYEKCGATCNEIEDDCVSEATTQESVRLVWSDHSIVTEFIRSVCESVGPRETLRMLLSALVTVIVLLQQPSINNCV